MTENTILVIEVKTIKMRQKNIYKIYFKYIRYKICKIYI